MTINFRGHVFTDAGNPVEGATVQLIESGSTTVEATFSGGTDSNGQWYFNEADQDEYDIKISSSSGNTIRYIRWDDQISVREIDVRNNTNNTTPAATFTNHTQNASNQVAVFSGANTTRADGDEIYLSFKLANDNAELTEFARITAEANDVSNGSEDGEIRFDVMKGGTLTTVWQLDSLVSGAMEFDMNVDALTIGSGADTDVMLTFDANSADGVITWMEDEDYFRFSDDILMNSTERINFYDTAIYIYSSTDGQLDLVADTEIQIAATTIDINGAVALNGAITGATNITLSGELDAATLDLSSSADIAGDLVLSGGADGALQFTNAGENSIKIPDNQASALIIEEDDNAYITFVTTNSSEAITIAKATTFSAAVDLGSNTLTTTGSLQVRTIDYSDGDNAITIADGGGTTFPQNAAFSGDLAVDGTANLDNTDIDGTLVVDGSNISLDSTSTLNIDNSNTSNGVSIATATSGVPVTLGHATSEVTVGDNLIVTGNLTVSGTTTTVTSTTVAIADSLLLVAKDQGTSADAVDFGIYGKYGESGTAKYAGIFRDQSATGDPWTFFDGNQAEPGTTVDAGGTGYDLAPISVGAITAADASTLASSTTIGNLTLADGSITDSSGAIDFGNETLTTTGVITAGGFTIGSAAILEAELEILDGASVTTAELNLIDGGTARGTTAVASGDGILINDAGTMRMTNVDTVSTYFASHNVGGGNIVTTGALDSGSITSNFGTINTGASTITTTGLISGGSLDIDNVLINGTTIGHTDDTDLLTFADAALTLKGTLTVGVDDAGHDVKFFGASAGAYMEWDEDADQLRIMGASADATTSTGKLLLATSLTDINANDVIGKIDFQAPHEAGGTDAITVAASIQAIAQGTFSSSVNATDLIFYTGHSEAATEKVRITSQGEIGIGGANYGSDGQVLTSAGAGAAVAWENASGGAALANDGDNRVVTADGSGGINGEANLAFDGTTLTVSSNLTISSNDPIIKQVDTNYSSYYVESNYADGHYQWESNINNTAYRFKDNQGTMAQISGTGNDRTYFAVQGDYDSNGKFFGIGTTGPNHVLHVSGSDSGEWLASLDHTSSDAYGLRIQHTGDASDDNTNMFLQCTDSGPTHRLKIWSDGDVQNHDGTFSALSDSRIKQNVVNANSQWTDIKALVFKNFKKKDDVAKYGEGSAPVHMGLIAQDLEATSPNLVKEYAADAETDGLVHDDFKVAGATVKGIKYSILFMKATKALQEAMARIETLETKVTALES